MKRASLLFVIASMVLLAAGVQAQYTWQWMATEAEITAVTGEADFYNSCLATDGNGNFVVCDYSGSPYTDKYLLIDPDGATKITQLTTETDMIAAINAANGTAADVSTSIYTQAFGFNSNGYLIAFLDSGSDAGTVIAVDPSNGDISVLSTAVDSNPSPVEGGAGMEVYGNTAYLLVDGAFGASEDAVLALDTSSLVNDGSLTPTTVIGQAALLAASGEADAANYEHNDAVFLDANTMILINSGLTAANDNLIMVDLSGTPAASLYVAATDIEADLGDADVGYAGIGADGVGELYLENNYGGATYDDAILILKNISPPNADASGDTEAVIAGDLGGTNVNYHGAAGIVYDPVDNRMVFSSGGSGCDGVVYKPMATTPPTPVPTPTPPASARLWMCYD